MLRTEVSEEAELDVAYPERLLKMENLLRARVIRLKLSQERPLLARVDLRAEHLELAYARRVVLEVGEHERVEQNRIRQRQSDPLLLRLPLCHCVPVPIFREHSVSSLHLRRRCEHLGAHIR